MTVMYPLSGSLTSSPLESPPHHHYWGNFAIDDAAGAGTAVHANFANPSGSLSLSLGGTFEPCAAAGTGGQGLIVNVAVNGTQIGRVYYAHLTGITKTSGTISNGAQIGVLYNGSYTGCWQGPHTHVEPKSFSGSSCFVSRSLGSHVDGAMPLGVIGGGYASGDNQTCPSGATSPGNSPTGSVDVASSPAPGSVRIGGWAFDADAKTTPIRIHAYVGGPAGSGSEGHSLGDASGYRPDVGRHYPGVGDHHGYDFTFNTSRTGNVPVCVYGINVGGGGNALLACKTVHIDDPSPTGAFDVAESPKAGVVRVRGWSFDPNAKTTPNEVHLYIGGGAGEPGAEGHNLGAAKTSRPDVGRAYPGVGDNHGFDTRLATDKVGDQKLCVYGINQGPGSNRLLGCKQVTIADPSPAGSVDVVESARAGVLHVGGWTFDRSDATRPLHFHVFVGGLAGQSGVEGHGDALGLANHHRPDVGRAYPGVGDNHGYDALVPTRRVGSQQVCIYGVNVGLGADRLLGCRTVAIAADRTAPDTSFVKTPPKVVKGKGKRRMVRFTVRSSEPYSYFQCAVDKGTWKHCGAMPRFRLKRGRHRVQVRAVDFSRNVDQTPAVYSLKVKGRKR